MFAIALAALRRCGAFSVARWLTRDRLRILCYHGVSLADEHEFRSRLFMRPETFRRRLALLRRARYPVLPLGEALAALELGRLPPAATVITIDDGWTGTALSMGPALREYGFPATLYVASYYMDRQTQVFNVACDYLLWRSGSRRLDLARVDPALAGVFELGNADARENAALALDMDPEAFRRSRVMSFMSREEARMLQAWGIDLQLHTHRHRLPLERFEDVQREFCDNRASLAGIAGPSLVHFCYPSGEYRPHQLPWLERCGIASATTTRGGFNRRGAPRYELKRFLDAEDIDELEFEAEMSGLLELLREGRDRLRGHPTGAAA
jgi:peptidoglycan/xylan/chitin deacetylase (PgdA/CDA1 family)